ncbi:MAG: phosphate acetyltransferase [Calditrichaeota bacterium]|nr:MAG: phosphate acetyltransferase [Calditrichota bacterium]MBL1205437.1 phosphate acetyltransferase [Calditrichota bacterium]NOG45266.1 phosphate acetyltransferase [Calditrichota bacterium]
MDFVSQIRQAVKQSDPKTILLPEGEDPRILEAAIALKQENFIIPVILGTGQIIKATAEKHNFNLENIQIIDPKEQNNTDFENQYYELRKHKGVSPEDAHEIIRDPLFYAAMMIRNNQADGALAGAVNTTGNVLRAAIQVIGLAENITAVSSCFFMVLKDGTVLTYGDCAVIPDPNVEQLASIALSTAETHLKVVHQTPNVAMLSFSTKGSAKHDNVSKVVDATELVRKTRPGLNVDGELQFDAAYNPEIAKSKALGSPVAGKANVFIFPDLDAGNIGYKITQRLGNAQAIGPIIQGLAKPYNDLSRGCSVEDVINTACILGLMA